MCNITFFHIKYIKSTLHILDRDLSIIPESMEMLTILAHHVHNIRRRPSDWFYSVFMFL